MRFYKPRLMRWNGNSVTDHNRSELNFDYNTIGTQKRTANGTLRQVVVAEKCKFSCSWSDLPNITKYTVDQYLGGRDMEEFYRTSQLGTGTFQLEITEGDNTVSTYEVMFTAFSKRVKKRGQFYDLWDLDVSFEEV